MLPLPKRALMSLTTASTALAWREGELTLVCAMRREKTLGQRDAPRVRLHGLRLLHTALTSLPQTLSSVDADPIRAVARVARRAAPRVDAGATPLGAPRSEARATVARSLRMGGRCVATGFIKRGGREVSFFCVFSVAKTDREP